MRQGSDQNRVPGGWRHEAVAVGYLLALAVLTLWISVAPALAQVTAPAPAEPPVTAEQIDGLVRTLEDPAAREKLIEQLRALKAAQGKPEETAGPSDGFGAELLASLSAQIDEISTQLGRVVQRVPDLPQAIQDLVSRLGDPAVRARWADFLVKLAIVLAAGIIVQWIVARLLAPFRRRLEGSTRDSIGLRLLSLVGRAIVGLVPIVAFAAVAYLALPLTEPRETTRLVTLAFVNAYLAVGVVVALARTLLTPHASAARLFPLSDESAHYVVIWVQRLAVVAAYGYFLVEAGLLLGLSHAAYELLQRLFGLVLAAMVVVLILQNRAAVAAWLRNGGATARFGQVRQHFADVWHILAIAYVAAVFVVWLLGISGGFAFLFRATVLTIAVILLARLVIAGLRRAVARGFRLSADLRRQFPGLEMRANRYLPVLQRALEAVVYLAAGLSLLEVWGIHATGWLDTDLGRRVVGSALAIALILALAIVLSDVIGMLIERYLQRSDSKGLPMARSPRMRTLLPLLRNAFRVVLAIVVGLVILAELGLNIGPLLAAAGVAGLAIGFGAQTLVQDVITGIFILAEDSIAIGDVVEVDGHSGSVEAMTIRTIQLRDLAGTVHTIPFSSVKTVKNLTKGFSYAVFDIGIAYREDIDEVIEVVKDIGADLQADETFGPKILDQIEVFGIDKFGDSAVIVKARIKTLPLQQWAIMREFNRRMKRTFDEKGIEIPFPHQTIYFGEDRRGNAPPVRVRTEPTEAGSPQRHRGAEEEKAP